MIRDILIHPDPRLKKPCDPVASVTSEISDLARDMLETMYDAPGIGLAAIQIAQPLRMLVIDLAKGDDEKDPQIFINPEILRVSDERSVYEEGCLSIPDYYAEVERPSSVCIKYIDRAGKQKEIEADGLLATCLQHEIDHLNGVLFIDHISKLKRDRVIKKFGKIAKHQGVTHSVDKDHLV